MNAHFWLVPPLFQTDNSSNRPPISAPTNPSAPRNEGPSRAELPGTVITIDEPAIKGGYHDAHGKPIDRTVNLNSHALEVRNIYLDAQLASSRCTDLVGEIMGKLACERKQIPDHLPASLNDGARQITPAYKFLDLSHPWGIGRDSEIVSISMASACTALPSS